MARLLRAFTSVSSPFRLGAGRNLYTRSAARFVSPLKVAVGLGLAGATVSQAGCQGDRPSFPNCTVLDSPALDMLLTKMRDKTTSAKDYVMYTDRAMRILAEEGLARHPTCKAARVITPCGPHDGLCLPDTANMCVVTIMRSGNILMEAVRDVAPESAMGCILVQRNEDDEAKSAKFFYSKFPKDIAERHVLLVDPMLATGGSAIEAIQCLKRAGVAEKNIMFLNVVCAPEGVQKLLEEHPEVHIVTAAMDERLNADKYIVPGLGDFGDRYYQTEH